MKYMKIGAMALAGLLLLSGCSTKQNQESEAESFTVESTQAAIETEIEKETETETEAPPEPFIIYCTDTLTGAFLQQYTEENPADTAHVQVQTVTEEELNLWMEGGITQPEAVPDMVVISSKQLGACAEAGLLADLSTLGMTEKATEQMYSFMKELGIYNDTLYGVTWQQTAKAFVYNRTLAKEYLEIENNDDMQAAIGEWSGLYNTALKADTNSGGTVKLFASAEEIKEALDSSQPEWYVEERLVIPDVMIDYLELYPALLANDLTWEYTQGSLEWLASLMAGSTIGCFGDAGLIQEVLAPYFKNASGNWGFCYGPKNFVTDADMIAVTKDCQDMDMAEEILSYLTCDKKAMDTFAAEQLVPVNHQEVMKALAETDTGKLEMLGGQNILRGYTSVAGKVTTRICTEEELALRNRFMLEVEACIAGEKNIEQALVDFAASLE